MSLRAVSQIMMTFRLRRGNLEGKISRRSRSSKQGDYMKTIKDKMRPIHPGEILREEFLAPLAMSAHALAMELKVPAPRINDIVRERRAITPDTALRLSRYFGTTAQFWLNLQTSYDLKIAEKIVGSKIKYEVHTRLVA